MTADLYDFDGTLFPGDSASKYWLFCLKRNPKIIRFLPKQIVSAFKSIFKTITLSEFKEAFFSFVTAIDAEKEAEKFWEKNEDKIFSWFKNRDKSVPVVVCSASPEFEISPILKRLGAEIIIGTDIDPETGILSGKNCKGQEKVNRLAPYLSDYHFRNAYTDNINSDAPLLSLAENRFKVNKNGEVEKLN